MKFNAQLLVVSLVFGSVCSANLLPNAEEFAGIVGHTDSMFIYPLKPTIEPKFPPLVRADYRFDASKMTRTGANYRYVLNLYPADGHPDDVEREILEKKPDKTEDERKYLEAMAMFRALLPGCRLPDGRIVNSFSFGGRGGESGRFWFTLKNGKYDLELVVIYAYDVEVSVAAPTSKVPEILSKLEDYIIERSNASSE